MNRALLALTLAPFGLFALGGCSKEQDAISTAKEAVRQALKDPPSARFGEAYFVQKAPGKDGESPAATCGTVDGKNGFGGYTGGARYVVQQVVGSYGVSNIWVQFEDYDGRKAFVEKDGAYPPETSFEHFWWNKNCVDATHPATRTGTYSPD